MMERWNNKIAVVTGASAGIGAVIAKTLVKSGLIVIGLARRINKMEEHRSELPQKFKTNFHPLKCDVTEENDVLRSFEWISKNFDGPDILINNAGCIHLTELTKENNTKLIYETIRTNIFGVFLCTRSAFSSMKKRNVNGHIILLNSIAGHTIPNFGGKYPSLNVYPATKFALTAMTEIYRQEFNTNNTKIKITSLSPGQVNTDILPKELEKQIKETMPMLESEDIANAVLYCLSTPSHVQVHELIIKPIGELF